MVMAAEKIIVLIVVTIPAIILAACTIVFNIRDIIKRDCSIGDFFRMFIFVGIMFGLVIWLSLDYVLSN